MSADAEGGVRGRIRELLELHDAALHHLGRMHGLASRQASDTGSLTAKHNARAAYSLASSLYTFMKRIKAEGVLLRALLEEATDSPSVINRVRSSNIHALAAVVAVALTVDDVVGLGVSLRYAADGSGEQSGKAIADVMTVAPDTSKAQLIKVKVAQPDTLHNVLGGHSRRTSSTFHSQIDALVAAAAQNTFGFVAPDVVVVLVNGVSTAVARELESWGVTVEGERIDLGSLDNVAVVPGSTDGDGLPAVASFTAKALGVAKDGDCESATVTQEELDRLIKEGKALLGPDGTPYMVELVEGSSEYEYEYSSDDDGDGGEFGDSGAGPHNSREGDQSGVGGGQPKSPAGLNLDVSAVVAYVSDVCQPAGCQVEFTDKVLAEQAAAEREKPLLPEMEAIMSGKRLVMCQTAYDSLNTILGIVAGPEEQERAAAFLEGVEVVPDVISERTERLRQSSRIKARARTVFGVGDALGFPTLTANSSFLRAALQQGIRYAAIEISARALTEGKRLEVEQNTTAT